MRFLPCILYTVCCLLPSTRMMELKKQQSRAPLPVRARTQTGKKQSPSARQLLEIRDTSLSDVKARAVDDECGTRSDVRQRLTACGRRPARAGVTELTRVRSVVGFV
jgi:hypothetical protein